jgi:hypothetical protein
VSRIIREGTTGRSVTLSLRLLVKFVIRAICKMSRGFFHFFWAVSFLLSRSHVKPKDGVSCLSSPLNGFWLLQTNISGFRRSRLFPVSGNRKSMMISKRMHERHIIIYKMVWFGFGLELWARFGAQNSVWLKIVVRLSNPGLGACMHIKCGAGEVLIVMHIELITPHATKLMRFVSVIVSQALLL